MVFRILGVISLGIGGVFGIIAMLVLLPFIDNFNTSLLVLCGVFGVLAYVFLAIGWQLFHPPSGSGRKDSEAAVTSDALPPSAHVGGAGSSLVAQTEADAATSASESMSEEESTEVDSLAALEADKGDDAPPPAPVSPNGAGSDQVHHPAGSGFKKPGAPVPHK